MKTVRIGNRVKCSVCGHERAATEAWISGVLRKYTPNSVRAASGGLGEDLVRRMKCSSCSAVGALEINGDVSPGQIAMCKACGGDGGYEGRCAECFGTGLAGQDRRHDEQ